MFWPLALAAGVAGGASCYDCCVKAVVSAGLLIFERGVGELRVLLAHPGGPFFQHKDEGFWTLPKGLVEKDETLETAVHREFREEVGLDASAPLYALGSVTQKAGKEVHAWAFEGSLPQHFTLTSNMFSLQWPPRSGRTQSFPEVDEVRMFALEAARLKIDPAQVAFLDRLKALIGNL